MCVKEICRHYYSTYYIVPVVRLKRRGGTTESSSLHNKISKPVKIYKRGSKKPKPVKHKTRVIFIQYEI